MSQLLWFILSLASLSMLHKSVRCLGIPNPNIERRKSTLLNHQVRCRNINSFKRKWTLMVNGRRVWFENSQIIFIFYAFPHLEFYSFFSFVFYKMFYFSSLSYIDLMFVVIFMTDKFWNTIYLNIDLQQLFEWLGVLKIFCISCCYFS